MRMVLIMIIQWYKDARALNLDSARGGVSLENEKTPQGTKSTLIVTKATDEDSGNYTCSPSSGHSTSVVVHVVDGENPRASQRGLSSIGTRTGSLGYKEILLLFSLTCTTVTVNNRIV